MKKLFTIVFILVTLLSTAICVDVFATESQTQNVSSQEERPNADFMVTDNYKFCGSVKQDNALIKKIPGSIPYITSSIYNSVLVIVPLILIIMGSIDLIRGITSQNEDEIKKGKTNFLKRLVIGIITFVVVLLVKFIVSALADNNIASTKIIECVDCFINNECGIVKNKR